MLEHTYNIEPVPVRDSRCSLARYFNSQQFIREEYDSLAACREVRWSVLLFACGWSIVFLADDSCRITCRNWCGDA